ncbi:MAG: hypothetical protein AB7K86_04235 [Rhodospirillales bacterium]
MAGQPHALIIGGSVGGLLAAGMFRTIGWKATVFERAVGDLAGRGAGLGMNEELLQVMRRIGARFDPSIGVAHRGYGWADRDGRMVFEHPRPTVGSAWSRVYQPLRDNVPGEIYRAGMTLERVEQDADSVTAVFADGSRATGDVLVAADGVYSTVRRQFLPEVQARYAGYVAWRGMVEERDLPRETLEMLAGRLIFGFPEGEMSLTMAVPGAGEDMRRGHRRVYFIWYRPAADDAMADLFTDASGKNHGIAIPPPLIRPELVADIKATAQAIFAPAMAAVVTRTAQPLLQAITDMESPRLTFGRVAMIGDAAFIARPHVAAGVTKAALDAQCLADSLAASGGDIPAGLAAYDRTQHRFDTAIVEHSRHLGAYLEARTKPPAERGADATRDPYRIIREYGAPHLLHDIDVTGFLPDEETAPV